MARPHHIEGGKGRASGWFLSSRPDVPIGPETLLVNIPFPECSNGDRRSLRRTLRFESPWLASRARRATRFLPQLSLLVAEAERSSRRVVAIRLPLSRLPLRLQRASESKALGSSPIGRTSQSVLRLITWLVSPRLSTHTRRSRSSSILTSSSRFSVFMTTRPTKPHSAFSTWCEIFQALSNAVFPSLLSL